MIVQREAPGQESQIHAVTLAAFGRPAEADLVTQLRAGSGWLPKLSLVALLSDAPLGSESANGVVTVAPSAGGVSPDAVIGHVVCTRALLGGAPALGLGPLSVHPSHQRIGVGSALMHAVLAAADAMDEPLVVLLGDPAYYSRFGFQPAADLDINPPVPAWSPHFQARRLRSYNPSLRGDFVYAPPFNDM